MSFDDPFDANGSLQKGGCSVSGVPTPRFGLSEAVS